jgi:dihydroxyacid dehydratase/phosphogluconate dehydratase
MHESQGAKAIETPFASFTIGKQETVMNLRSHTILQRPRWTKVRALFKSMGYSDVDLDRPLIGIANSWNRLVPGHTNLRQVAEYVTQGILQAGGTPVEFGVIAACDGIANGHEGMRFILPSRELIASSIETMVQAHRLDGVVLLGSCDKIVPGMLMAAARLDIAAILVNGGPAEGGCTFDGRAADITSVAEGLGMLKAGRIDKETYDRLEDQVMPSCGSCSFLGTANSMACVAEAMGMCLRPVRPPYLQRTQTGCVPLSMRDGVSSLWCKKRFHLAISSTQRALKTLSASRPPSADPPMWPFTCRRLDLKST